MSKSTWPDIALRIDDIEELGQVLASDRAIVFLTVDWSGPERKSRESFRQLIEMLGTAAIASVDVFVVSEDDDEVRQLFPYSIDCSCAPLGAGTMLWVEHGNVIACEINPGSVHPQQLFDRTVRLWSSFRIERGVQ